MTTALTKQYFERAITILALLGLFTTIHLWIMSERGFDRGCFGFSTIPQFEEMFDCESVLESDLGRLLGIPNVYWGMLFYSLLTGLNFLGYVVAGRQQKMVRIFRMVSVTVGFGYSIVLSYFQYNWAHELCALCLTSAIISSLIFVVSVACRKALPLGLMIPSEQLRFFSAALMATMFLAMGDVVYFGSLDQKNTLAATLDMDLEFVAGGDSAVKCQYKEDIPVLENYRDLIGSYDIKVGNPDSRVIIIEYFDPNCFYCKEMNEILTEATKKFAQNALFIFKPNPFWRHSIVQVQALLMASEENLFFEMLDRQFALQDPKNGLNLKQILEIANEIGMDEILLEERIRNSEYIEYLKEQRAIRRANGIDSAPTIIINGKIVHPRSRTVECFEDFIQEASSFPSVGQF